MTQAPVPEVENRFEIPDSPEPAPSTNDGGAHDDEAIPHRQLNRRRLIFGAIAVVLVFLIAVGAVIYGIGSLVHARDQRALMATERTAIANAAILDKALDTVKLPTKPPAPGAPVGVLAIPSLSVNEVVVEGVSPSQTVSGPGHVPGTAGLGQPGNAGIVGRNAAVRSGVRTTRSAQARRQGPHRHDRGSDPFMSSDASATVTIASLEPLFRATHNNRLTLVTSASDVPWNSGEAVVVTAVLRGKPYAATPQESRDQSQLGNTGESGAWVELILSVAAFAAVTVGALYLYRRCTIRSAYLLSTAPLVAFTVLAAESISRLFPAWM